MASHMQIGQAAQPTERAHQEGFSVSDPQQFLGTTGNKDPWYSVHLLGPYITSIVPYYC